MLKSLFRSAAAKTEEKKRALEAAPMHFSPAEGSAFFRPHGFVEVEYRSQITDVLRIGRAPWFLREEVVGHVG